MKISKMLTVFLGAIMVFNIAAVYAVNHSGDGTVESQPITIQEDELSQVKTREVLKDSIKERIAQLKEDRAIKLEAKREEIIVKKCENAQTRIAGLLERVGISSVRRIATYVTFGEKLTGFVTKLEEAGVDVTDLNATLAIYDGMVTDLDAQFDEYSQLLSDLSGMDCTTDPQGFQAGLDSARDIVSNSKNAVKAVHDYLRSEVRVAFTTAMQAFNNSSSESTDAGVNDQTEVPVEEQPIN